jgi:SOS response regulatory protein OraA/RecX
MSSSKRGHEASSSVRARLQRYAAAGVRSRQELLYYARRNGVRGHAAETLADECVSRGLAGDPAGARLWAGHWARRGYGSAAIRAKLEAKGFHAHAIDAALRAAPAGDEEARARILIAARRRAGRGGHAGLVRALGARGFDPDLIERLLDEAADHPAVP